MKYENLSQAIEISNSIKERTELISNLNEVNRIRLFIGGYCCLNIDVTDDKNSLSNIGGGFICDLKKLLEDEVKNQLKYLESL